MSYNLFQHKHNFPVWAAARATQRGWKGADVDNLRGALERCGLVDFLRDPSSLNTDKDNFRKLHKDWCQAIIKHLSAIRVQNPTFGRAAKLVAVYLKCMVVIGGHADSQLGNVAHPPIDRNLLRNITNAPGVVGPYQDSWKHINWTELDEMDYYNLVSQLATVLSEDEPFWLLEKYWTITK